MTVLELIEKLKELPQNMKVVVPGGFDENGFYYAEPNPEQEWDDATENYKVIL